MFIIVGLGNPGQDYEDTRHNTGRLVTGYFLKMFSFPVMVKSAKYQALVSLGKVKKEKVMVLFPETFMNKSGASLASLITSKKKAETLIVIHDDLDLPLGKIKISFNRGTGGHRGVLSIVKKIGTEAFVRIRVGISPVSPSGKIKKPLGDKEVEKHILGKWKPKEEDLMKKASKKIALVLEILVTEGRDKATMFANSD
ncbi:MAG TPA: aminoacyl-tRNA hydrolase [Candidatus Paceibacterota bacterium]